MSDTSSDSLKSILLLGALTAVFILCGQSMAGNAGVGVGLILALITNLSAYWFSDKLILSLYRAKEINQDDEPMLYATVAYLSEKAKIERPRIYVIPQNMPNAFAVGRSPSHASIAVTKGLLHLLNKDELAGVIAHEMGHILKRDILTATIAASIGGAIAMLANFAQSVFIFGMGKRREGQGNNRLAMILMSMLAPFFALLIQMSISRTREFAADEAAIELCGDPKYLSDALYKLEKAKDHHNMDDVEQNPSTAHLFTINPLKTKKWTILFSTHPAVGERIERLDCII